MFFNSFFPIFFICLSSDDKMNVVFGAVRVVFI